MEAYKVYVHIDLLDLVPVRGGQRKLVMSFLRSLAQDPHTPEIIPIWTKASAHARLRLSDDTRSRIGPMIRSRRLWSWMCARQTNEWTCGTIQCTEPPPALALRPLLCYHRS